MFLRRALGFLIAMILLLSTVIAYGEPVYEDIEKYLFQQEDARWKDYNYAGAATIGAYGCLITSIAMVESFYQGESINPKQIISRLNMKFSKDANLSSADNYAAINVNNNEHALEVLYEKLQNGPVILGGYNAIFSDQKHYMVVYGYTGDGKKPYKSADFKMLDNTPYYAGGPKTINTVYSFTSVDRYYNDGKNNDKWPNLYQVWYRTSGTMAKTYQLTATATTGGSAAASVNGTSFTGTVQAKQGAQVTLRATANSGYTFSGWSSTGGGTFANASSATTTFTMPSQDTTVTANFKLQSITQWQNMNAENRLGPDAVLSGRVVFANDRKLKEVECFLGTDENDVLFASCGEETQGVYKAVYRPVEGSAFNEGGEYRYADVHFTAKDFGLEKLNPSTRYYFMFCSVLDDDERTQSGNNSSDVQSFQSWGNQLHKLSVQAGMGGAGVTQAGGDYVAGQPITLSAQAADGYVFSHWVSSAGGTFSALTASNGCVFTMPDSDTTVTASFRKLTGTMYTLTLGADRGGKLLQGSGGTYTAQQVIPLKAKAQDGYAFVKWESTAGTFSDISNPETFFYMTSLDAHVQARFIRNPTSLSLSPSTVDMGTYNQLHVIPAYQFVEAKNTGTQPIAIRAEENPYFIVNGIDTQALVLEAGESKRLEVVANADLLPGTYQETLRFVTNEGATVATLPAQIKIEAAPENISSLRVRGKTDLGTWYEGTSRPAAQTFTVQYVGEGAIELQQPYAEGTQACVEIGALSRTKLNRNETATFTVRPKEGLSAGNYSCVVMVNYKMEDDGKWGGAVGLLGAGNRVSFNVFRESSGVEPSIVDFGVIEYEGETPAAKTVTITNTGTTNLRLPSPDIASKSYFIDADWYMEGEQIAPGQSVQLKIQPLLHLLPGDHDLTLQLPLTAENGTLIETIECRLTVAETISDELGLKNLDFGKAEPWLAVKPNKQTLLIRNRYSHSITLTASVPQFFTVKLDKTMLDPNGELKIEVEPKAGLAPGLYVEKIILGIMGPRASAAASDLGSGVQKIGVFEVRYEVLPYQLLSEENMVFTLGDGQPVRVLGNGSPEQLDRVLLNDKELLGQVKVLNSEGKTLVEIPASLLSNYPTGDYTITLVYRDKERITAKLSIRNPMETQPPVPQTGDNTPLEWLGAALVLSAGLFVGLSQWRKRKA